MTDTESSNPAGSPPPAVSVLLVTRNAMPWVAEAIAQAQAVPAAQVVAIDAASTDGTRDLLEAQRHWTVRQQESMGLAAARNDALAWASGEYVAFLDADDVWLPGKMHTQLRFLQDNPDIGIVTCLLSRTGACEQTRPQPAWTPSGCLIRREIFDSVGLFDESLALACDTEWFLRARVRGVPAHVLQQVLLHKRIHADNLSHDRVRYRRELAHVLRRHGSGDA